MKSVEGKFRNSFIESLKKDGTIIECETITEDRLNFKKIGIVSVIVIALLITIIKLITII